MKKLTIISVMAGLLFLQTKSNAQGGYVGLELGYGMPSCVQAFTPGGTDNYSQTTTGSGTTTSETNSPKSTSYSLGSGAYIGVYGGYMVTKNLGFELGLGDKLGSSVSTTFTNNYSYNIFSSVSTATTTNVYTATSSGLFCLTPSMRIMAGEGKIHPFVIVGLAIGVTPGATYEDKTTMSTPGRPDSVVDEITTYSGGLTLGFHGGIGVMYNINDMIGITLQLNGTFMDWAPSKGLITTYTLDGTDETGNLTTSQKETDYSSSPSTTTTNGQPNPGSATVSTLQYYPFSQWGFRVGINLNFGSK